MSLLLEALKKAEKAKEEAQRRARGEDAGGETRLDAEPAPQPKPVMTRPELPDIRQPLEILSDDIAPKAAASVAEKPAPATQAQKPATQKPEAQAAERATAKKVFEAKFREPNPRMPFYITMGLLGVFALGTVGYFWYQLRPPPALVNANPPRTNSAPAPQVAEAKAIVAPSPVAAAPSAIPGLPVAATTSHAAVAAPAPEPKAAEPKAAAEPKPPAKLSPRLAQALGTPVAPAAAPLQREPSVSTSRAAAPQVNPQVESGYSAYLAGDFATARTDYQQALREDAGNRDALLGLAAIDVRTGRFESAEAAYLRLLQVDPNDAHAQAGLIALRGARLDPLATESRVKNMLAADPGANVLHFTLGNQLAQQGRWAEAQQEYFKAFAAEPDSADIAYNLAVSLDHLRQPKLALEYYKRAVTLAEQRGASFDVAAARTRAAQLAR